MISAEPLLRVRGLGKAYAAPVLSDFDFDLMPGEVHALVGANGAGKSTFVRMVSGLAQPDSGRMELAGRLHAPRSRREAEQAGVVIILQELNILPTLSIAENLCLDHLPHRSGWVLRRQLQARARTALERVGLGHLAPETPAGELGVGEQQLVEIAGALDRNCRLLILDEPTAALTAPECDRLFAHLRTLQAAGAGLIYITHRMDEIRRIANRVSVLRDGRRIVTRPASETTPAALLRDMVGELATPVREQRRTTAGAVSLRVEHLHAGDRVRDVNLTVRAGEILGLAGLIGSGRTETLRAIFGADRRSEGRIFVGEAPAPAVIRSPHDAVRLGIGFVPEDRATQGLLLPLSVALNTALAATARDATARSWIRPREETKRAVQAGGEVGVRCASPEQPVRELSGGNQQKVVLARWLLQPCSVLLVDEPTRGIDVAAKQRIHDLLRAWAAAGKAIVVVSSETPELFALCDRILVMSAGRVTAELDPTNWTEEAVLSAAFRHHLASPSP